MEPAKNNSENKITVKIQDTPIPENERQELRKQMLSYCNPTITCEAISSMQNVLSKTNTAYSMSDNGFFDSFYAAYVFHGDVQISADIIWLTVCDRLSTFVLDHKKMCRPYLVSHKGKKTLTIFLNLNEPDFQGFPRAKNRWDKILGSFGKLIGENVKGDVATLMQSNFSSSKMVETAAANIYLMSTVKSYFSFLILCGGCGIQNVHFEGNVGDYEKLLMKVKKLQVNYPFSPEFTQYLENVQYVVKKFIETINFPNKVDVNFWNGIFKVGKGDGMSSSDETITVDVYTGWITYFFNVKNIETSLVPAFRAKVPVLVKDLFQNSEYKLSFQTEINGIEEVAPNVFRPIINVAFHKDNGN